MEERNNGTIRELILNGCRLARDLESSLQNSGAANNHPTIMTQRCDEIIEAFVQARRNHLISMHPPPPDHDHDHHHQHGVAGRRRSTSRNDGQGQGERRVVRREPVPLMGNTEVPPDDGFTWRKYGQKEILNASYPRSYYRCTHQKLYGCPAKKQVQRLNEDPNVLEIIYRGEHTCHMSPTAPAMQPSTQAMMITPHHPITAAVDHPQVLPNWLLDLASRQSGEGGSSILTHHHHHQELFSSSAPSSAVGSMSHHDHQERDGVGFINQNPVLDDHFDLDHMMMFNSGSSGSNSMEVIFPPSADDRKD